MIENFTIQTFAELLNTNFKLRQVDGEATDAQLVEVTDCGTTPRQERFSLLFRTSLDRTPAQWLYHLEHEALGAFELFLVPVRMDAQGLYYEAIFNRLRKVK